MMTSVSPDAVRWVPTPTALPVSRATMKFLNVSSVPAFGLFSLPLRHSLFRQCARGSSLTCHPFVPRSVPFVKSLSSPFWCQDIEQDSFCKRNNPLRVVAVIRCPERRDATCSTCVSRDTKSSVPTNHGQMSMDSEKVP